MRKESKFWFTAVSLSLIAGVVTTRVVKNALEKRRIKDVEKHVAKRSSLISANLKLVRDRTDARIAVMDNPTRLERERVWNEEYERFFHPNS